MQPISANVLVPEHQRESDSRSLRLAGRRQRIFPEVLAIPRKARTDRLDHWQGSALRDLLRGDNGVEVPRAPYAILEQMAEHDHGIRHGCNHDRLELLVPLLLKAGTYQPRSLSRGVRGLRLNAIVKITRTAACVLNGRDHCIAHQRDIPRGWICWI
jgi:hypothetical protein